MKTVRFVQCVFGIFTISSAMSCPAQVGLVRSRIIHDQQEKKAHVYRKQVGFGKSTLQIDVDKVQKQDTHITSKPKKDQVAKTGKTAHTQVKSKVKDTPSHTQVKNIAWTAILEHKKIGKTESYKQKNDDGTKIQRQSSHEKLADKQKTPEIDTSSYTSGQKIKNSSRVESNSADVKSKCSVCKEEKENIVQQKLPDIHAVMHDQQLESNVDVFVSADDIHQKVSDSNTYSVVVASHTPETDAIRVNSEDSVVVDQEIQEALVNESMHTTHVDAVYRGEKSMRHILLERIKIVRALLREHLDYGVLAGTGICVAGMGLYAWNKGSKKSGETMLSDTALPLDDVQDTDDSGKVQEGMQVDDADNSTVAAVAARKHIVVNSTFSTSNNNTVVNVDESSEDTATDDEAVVNNLMTLMSNRAIPVPETETEQRAPRVAAQAPNLHSSFGADQTDSTAEHADGADAIETSSCNVHNNDGMSGNQKNMRSKNSQAVRKNNNQQSEASALKRHSQKAGEAFHQHTMADGELCSAVQQGDLSAVGQAFNQEASIYQVVDSDTGYTLFMSAVRAGNKGIVEAFLQQEKRLEKKDKKGKQSLVKIVDKTDKTPLMYACDGQCENPLDMISLLASYGADLNVQDKRGYTAIMIAIEHYDKSLDTAEGENIQGRVIQALRLHKADMYLADNTGMTTLMLAVKLQLDRVISLLCDYEIVRGENDVCTMVQIRKMAGDLGDRADTDTHQMLGADAVEKSSNIDTDIDSPIYKLVNALDHQKETALTYAITIDNRDYGIVHQLVRRGAARVVPDCCHPDAFMYAVAQGNSGAAYVFFNNKQVSEKKDSLVALRLAISQPQEYVEVVKRLYVLESARSSGFNIEQEYAQMVQLCAPIADTLEQELQKETLLGIACARKHVHIVELLLGVAHYQEDQVQRYVDGAQDNESLKGVLASVLQKSTDEDDEWAVVVPSQDGK